MSGRLQRLLFLLSDTLAINLASIFFLWEKFLGGALQNVDRVWVHQQPHSASGPNFLFALDYYLDGALPLICGFWLLLFLFYGLYRTRPLRSRFDTAMDVVKVVAIGNLLLFVLTFDTEQPLGLTRTLMFTYWAAMSGLVGGGRVAVRTFERQLLARGIGRRRAVIVGSEGRGQRLLQALRSTPAQGYEVVGFVRPPGGGGVVQVDGIEVLGEADELPEIVDAHQVSDVLIALQSNAPEEVMAIVSATGSHPISFSITPDLYDIVTGHVRTTQIYGVPLIALEPELMSAWEQTLKRLIDVTVGIVVGIGLLPLWVVIAVLIKIESRGPVLFRQKRVGKDGQQFMIYKFRSMVIDAEESTGPIWASGEDSRVTLLGRILRALHLDEVPQCMNFLKGEMSLVGPRPERPYFVERFARDIPFYMRRFNVKPGLLGWAQSKHEFDLNSEDVVAIARERLEYDLYYIENISLSLDLKIMLLTVWFVLAGKSTR